MSYNTQAICVSGDTESCGFIPFLTVGHTHITVKFESHWRYQPVNETTTRSWFDHCHLSVYLKYSWIHTLSVGFYNLANIYNVGNNSVESVKLYHTS